MPTYRTRSNRPLRGLLSLAAVLCGLLVAAPARAQLEVPRGLADTLSSFPSTLDRGFYNIDSVMRVTSLANPNAGTFWSQQFWFREGDGGYMGLQTQGRLSDDTRAPRVAIFSILDNNGDAERGLSESHPNCVSGDDEGPYVRCAISYPWSVGRDYRLRIYELCCSDQPNSRERWGAWVRDQSTGVETEIGVIEVPGGWGWLRTDANAFVEHHTTSVDHCSNLPYTKASFAQPTANVGTYTASTDGIVGGYGPCVDFARGYTLAGRDHLETGIAYTNHDSVHLTIDHYYRAGLGRDPDTAGRDYWRQAVGTTDGSTCRENLRGAARNMHASSEYQSRWTTIAARVDHLYQSVLQRRPDSDGRSYWINQYSALGGNWPALVGAFVASGEATQRLGAICTYRY